MNYKHVTKNTLPSRSPTIAYLDNSNHTRFSYLGS